MVRGTDTPLDVFEKVTTWIGSPGSFVLHTVAFILAFLVGILDWASWTIVLLVLTTVVSLEAIYLSIFIQMTVNRHSKELEEVSEDVEDIQSDIDEIQEDVEEISEDVEGIQEDIEEISEDVEEINEEETIQARKDAHTATLEVMAKDIQRLLKDLEQLKKEE